MPFLRAKDEIEKSHILFDNKVRKEGQNMKYKNLFSPLKVNSMILKNRIIAAPIGEEFSEKALGGAALVICGHTIVEPGRSSFASGNEQSGFFKYEVEKTQEKIRQCHRAGARASIEIFHAGQYARVLPGEYAVGPCSFIREDGVEVKALDKEGMERIANLYAQSALDAKNLGFDAIFLHFAHGWLPAQFISPLFNHRSDEYGGSLENRAKFPLMILERIRQAVGPNYPIDMRISGEECVPGSIEFKDTLQFILMAEPYIDSVQISAGLDINHEGNVRMATTNFCEHMPNVKWAREVKKHVKKIKVAVVGAIMNPQEAEDLIANEEVDLVAFGRSFIADPYWPNKARDGEAEDIVPCIRCLQCYHISTNRRNVGCSVNPRYHNERFIEKELKPCEKQKKVVVIGAGPAGIMASITASKRGHHVILLEKENKVGGTLNLISKEYYKEDIRAYLDYLKNQLAKSTVEVHLSCEADPQMVKELKPDALVIAVGGKPVSIPIKGSEQHHVISYVQALEDESLIGDSPLIIGGGTIGAELALELAELKGKHPAIVELTDTLASQGNMLYRIALRQKYESLKEPIQIYYQTKCIEIKGDEAVLQHQDGSLETIKADTVIMCVGVRSDRSLVESFYDITPEIYEAGDAVRTRKIQEAVFEGYGIGAII